MSGRALTLLAAVSLAAVAALLVCLPAIPFQDYPNHLFVLRLDLAASRGRLPAIFEQRPVWIGGYSLYVLATRALTRVFAPDSALRTLVILAALGLPFSLALVAKSLGHRASPVVLLSAPLSLSWPLRMGFVSYALGLPLLFLWLASFIVLLQRRSRGAFAASVVAGALCYLAHPLAWIFALPPLAFCWSRFSTQRRADALRLLASIAPGLAIAAHDLAAGGFSQVARTEGTWRPSPLSFRPLGQALAHVVTRSWGIPSAGELVPFLPLIALLTYVVAGALRSAREGSPLSLPLVAGLGALAGSLLLPTSFRTTWLLGDRAPVIGVALLCVATGELIEERRGPAKGFFVVAALLALGASARSIWLDGERIASAISPRPAQGLSGRYLTFRLSDVGEKRSRSWGAVDPWRHIWTYALEVDGATPYLFAFTHYLPVRYEPAVFWRSLRAPPEWEVNEWRPLSTSEACERYDSKQLLEGIRYRYGDFAGVIAFGDPERLARVRPLLAGARVQSIAPGLALVQQPR